MSSTSAFPEIPVTAPALIRQVGHGAYTRGQRYMRDGMVVRYTYDEGARTLTGQVAGSGSTPYETSVIFPAEVLAGSSSFTSYCSCPVSHNCKHAVALMLTAIDRSAKAKKALTASSSTWRSSAENEVASLPVENKQKLVADLRQQMAQREAELALPAGDATETMPPADGTASKLPAWRRSLAYSLSSRPSFDSRTHGVSGALDLRLVVPGKYGWSKNNGAPKISLEARPVMMGARGKWIKGGLTWEKFSGTAAGASGTGLLPEHASWFTEFYAVIRGSQSIYSSHREWASISNVDSSLLWQLLRSADELNLPILLDGQEAGLAVADEPAVELSLETVPERGSSSDALRLTPILRWGGYTLPANLTHKLGVTRRGFIALSGAAQKHYVDAATAARWESALPSALAHLDEVAVPSEGSSVDGENHRPSWLDAEAQLVLIPLAEPLEPVAEALVSGESVTVPAADVPTFFSDFYPQLTRSLPLFTADEKVQLPAVRSPQLVLTVEFTPGSQGFEAATRWHWDYPAHPVGTDDEVITLDALGYPGEDRADIRDTAYEHRVLKEVKRVRPGVPFGKNRFEGWSTRTLLETYLPAYRDIDGVQVELLGQVPEFRELDEAPEIVVTVDDTRRRDWFGLGIAIKAGEWHVAFADVLAALAKGQTHLLLGNGEYFALDRPEFMKLQELLREARELSDKSGPLEISRHQVGLWEELEELAAETQTVATWDEQVAALLDLDHHSPADVPATLTAELRPYQVEGYQWLAFLWEQYLGGVLADDMGLGKTMQTIALFLHAKSVWEAEQAEKDTQDAGGTQASFPPFLVVAPTSVVPNWVREIHRFAPSLKVVGIEESTRKSKQRLTDTITGADVVVTSYALFRLDEASYFDIGADTEWNGLILDEAQFVKNAKTKAHKIARNLPARVKIAVTGTPMENNLMELWSMFSISAPGLFPSARAFKDTYATPIESGEETKALGRLRRRVRPLMKRRTKELVAADLPEKTDVRVDVPLAPAHRKAYDTHLQRERQKILGLLEDMDKNRFTIFQSLTTLRRLALDASLIDAEKYGAVESSKLDYLQENLPEIIHDGHRALIFSQFTSYLKKIAERLADMGIPYLYLDGSTRNRGEILEAFEQGTAPIFLISLKAGGFGLNLTSADYCFIMDPWWNPAAEQQAVDRVHRIGQTKNVMVYRLVSAGTIEEKVMELKDTKAALFDAVVDEGQFFSGQLTATQVRDLLTSASEDSTDRQQTTS
ncbi:DEAD/DEAH box helicase [Rothia sp. (in: high G+C Gram-positive bacteria)]|uniref:DEAD/DEAH box helicase n=1 Tax=Rothia sp. (in: high G+C Gram-positive bacteria) TaxID=1885016 RepID=UPI0032162DC3